MCDHVDMTNIPATGSAGSLGGGISGWPYPNICPTCNRCPTCGNYKFPLYPVYPPYPQPYVTYNLCGGFGD